ncbi:hypothetical protein TRL7639_01888 [Falsiruegeria litorea R37]|uniref:HNH endonuclease 5 domain-containing protein n=1 Tax=Falsiruegeria litorea R37 TaxID=1200284 RepID=A0A1Y5SEW1_9RHOB|nr:hypothetical protein [Falsiruegeria litorea]SLN38010.1 hypothetical protein TRL7639_01888 [Falsiruegeria litorea R37]
MKKCAYCHNTAELRDSHAIPDAFFRSISKDNNGQLIAIPGSDGKIHLSQDTGKAKLLCEDCEREFNKRFDAPLVNAYRTWDKAFIEKGSGATLSFSAEQLAQGLASIFWRASVSGNDFYENASVTTPDIDRLLNVVNADRKNVLKLCSCFISRLYDKNSQRDGGFKTDSLSKVILPVTAYRINVGGTQQSNSIAFAAVFQGFISHITIPRLPYKFRNKPGYLKPGSVKVRAPRTHFADYEPLMEIMVEGKRKEMDGQSSLKN